MPKLVAIDPPNCGCTECLIGEYRPLSYATAEEVALMLMGRLANHTSEVFHLGIDVTLTGENFNVDDVKVNVRAEYSGLSWTLPRVLGEQVIQARALRGPGDGGALPY